MNDPVRSNAEVAVQPAATDALLRALKAKDPAEKELIARRALQAPIDDLELKALLRRQIYIGRAWEHDWIQALEIAEENIESEALGDLARQDAARAASALGAYDAALGHLRVAARIAPAERRAFHTGALASLLRFGGRPEASVEAYEAALRWASTHRPLYRAQLELARLAANDRPQVSLEELNHELEDAEFSLGYSDWVRGEILFLMKDYALAKKFLLQFVERLAEANPLKVATLRLELLHAQRLLSQL